MSTRMLIDARHPEETRVTVVKGSRVEEFDYESASKRPLKGNIYLARVTRVEPSLQAAFVEYGGNRHGFLAFSEIHPDYYQIPLEDRQQLIEAETKAALERAEELDAKLEKEAEEAEKKKKSRRRRRRKKDDVEVEASPEGAENAETEGQNEASSDEISSDEAEDSPVAVNGNKDEETDAVAEAAQDDSAETKSSNDVETADLPESDSDDEDTDSDAKDSDEADKDSEIAEAAARRQALRALKRRYSIQEVIKRRQVLLVQVVKEERGNKGAALTTYMSLAGRYCVLMPNSTHSGGISRKISNASDRRSLKKIISALEVPDEMGLIVRTAGMERTKTEIKRDYDYLLRLWNGIRDLTLKSVAPTLIYEEGNLIKRTIRDLYTRDIDEIQVEGEAGYRAAKDFMKLLMPSHAKKVQHYQDPIPLFHRYQVESHLEAMYQPVVQLKSGGYIVINPTEALISIDVNSGRATKEHNIEETALKTNLEAAEEVARQLRLRDMAGLVVIDFIDMEERSNNRAVERRMKEVLKSDRARIQVGRISSFGLMEMSRQRLRSNLLEVSMEVCPHCGGTGVVRSTESAALMALRLLEEEGIRARSSIVRVSVCPDVAVYLLNKKRGILTDLETQYSFEIEVLAQPSMGPSDIEITREAGSGSAANGQAQVVKPDTSADDMPTPAAEDETDGDRQPRKRRRRRRRRRGGGDGQGQNDQAAAANENETGEVVTSDTTASDESIDQEGGNEERKPRRRRGSRGGRRRSERSARDNENADTESASEAPENTEGQSSPDEEKPRRRRRVRKKTSEETAETSADAPSDDSNAASDETPKPRRTRRRKASPEVDTKDQAESGANQESEKKPRRSTRKKSEEKSSDQSEAANPEGEKKPRRRTRKKADSQATGEKSAEPTAEDKPKRGRPRKTAAEKTTDDNAVKTQPATNAEKTVSSEPPAQDDKPKRQGWWQRTFG